MCTRVHQDVTAPDGTTWRVANHWYRRPRFHRLDDEWDVDAFDALTMPFNIGFDDPGSFLAGIVIGLVAVVLLALVVLVLLPLVLFILEIPLVIVLVFLVRRLWIVDATSSSGESRTWHVRGWLPSRRAVREVSHELERGVIAEPAETVPL